MSEKLFALHQFFMLKNTAYSRSSLKANVCIFMCISIRNFCSRDVVGFYLAWRGWIISLRVARCLSLYNVLQFFILKFLKTQPFFSILILLSIPIEKFLKFRPLAAYLEPCETSMMELFAYKDSFYLFIIFLETWRSYMFHRVLKASLKSIW